MYSEMSEIKLEMPGILHTYMKKHARRKGLTLSLAYQQAVEEWLKTSIGYYVGGRNEDKRPRT